ncbi:MAG TPA: hypothetical protein VHM20_07425, partial [Gammaproteobacteria bacterium]|nr:hypothetical protein [Gammaproteobacteria bacterium]
MQSSTYTDLISRQAKFEFHGSRIESEMENHANVVCYENVTFVRPISSHATIKTEKNADFLSYISPHAKIIAKETPTFHSEICDHVSIECPGQPNFKPGITIGHHVKVNGKIIPPTGQPQSISVIGVNGDFSGGYVSVSGNSLLSSTSAMASLLNNHDSNVGNVSLPSRDNLNSYSDEM